MKLNAQGELLYEYLVSYIIHQCKQAQHIEPHPDDVPHRNDLCRYIIISIELQS